MKFRPLHDRVLVRRIEAAEKTAGGIIIPDSAQEKPQEGEVVATGTGTRAEDGTITPLDVKAGDRILFGKWSGSDHEGKRRSGRGRRQEGLRRYCVPAGRSRPKVNAGTQIQFNWAPAFAGEPGEQG
jgi:chaperonin GroES